jgi:hypothetical protein
MLYKNKDYAAIVSAFENGGTSEIFEVKNENDRAFYSFIKRDISAEIFGVEHGQYFDIITPFDYGGIYCSSPAILPIFFEKFSAWCKENSIVSEFIRFDPCEVFDIKTISSYIEIKKINELIYIDLTIDFWQCYSKGRKSDIARVKKEACDIYETTIESFYPLYLDSMIRNKAHDYFYFYKDALQNLVNEKFARVFAIAINERLMSSIIILDDNDRSYYFLGASQTDMINTDANTVLLHEVALRLKSEGRQKFFLGGGREGVYNFKQRFSKKTLPYYIGCKIHNKEVYDDLVRLAGRDENNFFPKYREKII